jgi:lysyl-tRNA synthetase class 2
MDARHVRLLGGAVEVAGVATVGSAFVPAWPEKLPLVGGFMQPDVAPVAAGITAFAGIALVIMGRGVAGRRWMAWLLAVMALLIAAGAHALRGVDPAVATVAAAAAGVLVWQRRVFVVRPAPALPWRLVRIAALALAMDFAYGVGALAMNAEHVTPGLSLLRSLRHVTLGLVGLPGPLSLDGRFGHWFPPSLSAAGMLTLIMVASVAFAPTAIRDGDPREDFGAAARLLDRPDGNTLDPFVLRRDKRRIYSSDLRAAVGFRYVRGVGLATGDPIGDPAAFEGSVRNFVDHCERQGWRPAVLGAREECRDIYQRHGLQAMYVGDEAIIDVDGFNLEGRRMRNARQAVTRTEHTRVTTEFHREGGLDPALRDQLLAVADSHHAPSREFGFSMALGGLLSGDYPECLVVVARDRNGDPVAFQRYALCRQGRALSLDSMRRAPHAPNGVNERMIADTVERAQATGVAEVSLNFAAFRRLFDGTAELTGTQAARAWLLRGLEGRFGIQMDTLGRFNAKFCPRWIPRYLIYRSTRDLPAIGLAALSAEGFLPFDANRNSRAQRGRATVTHLPDVSGYIASPGHVSTAP